MREEDYSCPICHNNYIKCMTYFHGVFYEYYIYCAICGDRIGTYTFNIINKESFINGVKEIC